MKPFPAPVNAQDKAALLAAALAEHRSGNVSQAMATYRAILASDPNNAYVLNLLGAAHTEREEFDEAARCYDLAISANAAYGPAHDNKGVLLFKQGKSAEAIESFRKALEVDPNNVATMYNLASAQVQSERTAAAIETFFRITELQPNAERAHRALASLFEKQKRLPEALVHLQEIVRIRPDSPADLTALAFAQLRAGRKLEAEGTFRDALKLAPDNPEAYANLGEVLVSRNLHEEALTMMRQALQLRPNHPAWLVNAGTILLHQEDFEGARAYLEEAVRQNPKLIGGHNNLATLNATLGNLTLAEDHIRRALEIEPENADLLFNLSMFLLKQLRFEESMKLQDRLFEIVPLDPQAHHVRAFAHLAQGQLRDGWLQYEWRFKAREFATFHLPWPLWNGGSLEGRTIAIVHEQGLGDTLQFCRLAKKLKDLGATVALECAEKMHPLMSRVAGIDRCILRNPAPRGVDVCVPILSLPYLLDMTLETIPTDVPYLSADPALVEAWRPKLEAIEEFKIGIAWQGNSKFAYDRLRSIPLAAFAPLAAIPGVRLVNLQAGHGREQLDAFGPIWNVLDFGQDLDASHGAFMDTAAIMKHLDLVITSDTSAAHLAGGLGVPVWVALGFAPDWRWLLDRGDSPWYPTMRLFRQKRWMQWNEVFERIAEEVQKLMLEGKS